MSRGGYFPITVPSIVDWSPQMHRYDCNRKRTEATSIKGILD